MNYNQVTISRFEGFTFIGTVVFLIAIALLVLSLFAIKHHHSKSLFTALILLGLPLLFWGNLYVIALGTIVIRVPLFIDGLLIAVGGIIGILGIFLVQASNSK